MGAELYHFGQFGGEEQPTLDTARLGVLRQALGDKRCREIVEEVVFHLSDRMASLKVALESEDLAEAQTLTSRLASLSEQVGLIDFARVARDLSRCLGTGDVHATGAVAARLMRLGEDSLFAVMLYADPASL